MTAHLPMIPGTVSSEPSTIVSLAALDGLPERIDDTTLAVVEQIASAPIPPIELADAAFIAKCLRMMSTLPRRKDDDVGGALRVRTYEIAIGGYPKPAIEYLVREAIRSCRFFPSPPECIQILKGWQRDDEALRMKLRAQRIARIERQARFEETMQALARGQMDDDAINDLPAFYLSAAETYGHIRMVDGRWVRRRHEPQQTLLLDNIEAVTASLAKRFPTTRDR